MLVQFFFPAILTSTTTDSTLSSWDLSKPITVPGIVWLCVHVFDKDTFKHSCMHMKSISPLCTHTHRLTLIVDGETSEAVTVLTSEPNPVLLGNQLYVGGAVDSSISIVTESFRGCIDNVNINGR